MLGKFYLTRNIRETTQNGDVEQEIVCVNCATPRVNRNLRHLEDILDTSN